MPCATAVSMACCFACVLAIALVLDYCPGLCWGSWPLLGRLLAVLGCLGPKNGAEYDYLEIVLISQAEARSAASGAIFGRSGTLCWRAWAAPGAYVVALGPLLGAMVAILGLLVALLHGS